MAFAVNEINQMSDKQRQFAGEILYAANQYIEIAGLLEKYGQSDASLQVQRAYRDELVQRSRLNASSGALRVTVEKMISGRAGAETADNVAQMYLDTLDELHVQSSRTIDKGNEMQEFKKGVWELAHPGEPFVIGGDDDLAMVTTGTGADDNLVCPITRMELVDPVKNNCGHIFSKDAVVGYLRTHSRSRVIDCPVAGCPHSISKDTIRPDPATQQRLANLKKRKRPENEENVEDL